MHVLMKRRPRMARLEMNRSAMSRALFTYEDKGEGADARCHRGLLSVAGVVELTDCRGSCLTRVAQRMMGANRGVFGSA